MTLIIDNSRLNMIIKSEPIKSLSIIEYIEHIGNIYHSEFDSTFMKFLMELYESHDEFCVSSDMLATYRVLNILSNRITLKWGDVQKFLDRLNLTIHNKDYELRSLQTPHLVNGVNNGTKKRIIAMLTPDAFKICLMNSANEPKYRKYYLLLEKCIYFYSLQQRTKVITLETTNSDLLTKLDELNNNICRQTNRIDILISEIKGLRKTIDNICQYLVNIAIPPTNKELSARLVIMKLEIDFTYDDDNEDESDDEYENNNEYHIIRRQQKSLRKLIKIKEDDGFEELSIINDNVPNAVYLWNNIHLFLKEHDKIIKIGGNTYKLKMREKRFIKIIQSIFNSRIIYDKTTQKIINIELSELIE